MERQAPWTITIEADGWVAYVRLEDPPGLSPITTVGRFDTVGAAQVATDEVWASRWQARRTGSQVQTEDRTL